MNNRKINCTYKLKAVGKMHLVAKNRSYCSFSTLAWIKQQEIEFFVFIRLNVKGWFRSPKTDKRTEIAAAQISLEI